MKQKIIAALKTKYQRFGLSNEAIDRIASAKEKTVTSEEGINDAITDVETMTLIATEVQRQRDGEIQRRTDLSNEYAAYKEKHPETQPAPQEPAKATEADEPEWAKKLREQQEKIAARFAAEDQAKILNATRENVEARLKANGCTNPGILKSVLKGFALAKDETEDAAVERLKGEYNTSFKETFGDGPKAGMSAPTFGDEKARINAMNDFLRSQGNLPKEQK